MSTMLDLLMKFVPDIKPEPEESGREYTIRLAEEVYGFKPWKDLPVRVQDWCNTVVTQIDERDKLQEKGDDEGAEALHDQIKIVDGFVAVPAASAAPIERTRRRTEAVEEAKSEFESEPEPKSEPEPEPAPRQRAQPAVSQLRGRQSTIPLDTTITVLTNKNPHRAGTRAEKLWDNYKTGVTCGQMMDAGMSWRDIHIDRKNGSIKLDGVDDTLDPRGLVSIPAEEPRAAPQYQAQGDVAAIVLTILRSINTMTSELIDHFEFKNEDKS